MSRIRPSGPDDAANAGAARHGSVYLARLAKALHCGIAATGAALNTAMCHQQRRKWRRYLHERLASGATRVDSPSDKEGMEQNDQSDPHDGAGVMAEYYSAAWVGAAPASEHDPLAIPDPMERVALINCLEADLRLRSETRERLEAARHDGDADTRTRLQQVWNTIFELWPNAEYCMNFMFTAHPMLRDWRPVDAVLDSSAGTEAVLGLVARTRFSSAA